METFYEKNKFTNMFDVTVPLPPPGWIYALDGDQMSLGSYKEKEEAIRALETYFNCVRKCGSGGPYFWTMTWNGDESVSEAVMTAQRLEIAALKKQLKNN